MFEAISVSTDSTYIYRVGNPVSASPDIRISGSLNFVSALHLFAATWSDIRSSENLFIKELPDSRYKLIKFIPVSIEEDETGVFIARFSEANISITGENREAAKEDLSHYILDVFELFLEEDKLGKGPKKDLAILRQYILADE